MRKKYTISLTIIVILLTISLSLTTSYGLWKINNKEDQIITKINGCFEIIYPSDEIIKNTSFNPLNEENGKATEPFSISIKNICKNEKKAEIRLNIKEENELNTKGLTVFVQGDESLEPTKYNKLKNSRANMTGLSYSKNLVTVNIKPNSTSRINIKLWIDEKVINSISKDSYLDAEFDITDKETITLPTFKETILENNGGLNTIFNKDKPNFTNIAIEDEGIFTADDEDGTSYYFRGASTNNYVLFANQMWRIIRINGDETIRLILENSLEESEFNIINNANQHAGFTYLEDNVIKRSTIYTYLDNWYKENIKKYDNFIAFSQFCNDTNNYINNWHNFYQASARLVGEKNPILTCEDIREDYGGLYRNRIGLITADEAVLAGASYFIPNTSYYLNNGTDFFTMTPRDYYYSTTMFVIRNTGSLEETLSNNKKNIRPVISLKANTVVIGDGTKDNPYKIDEDANK